MTTSGTPLPLPRGQLVLDLFWGEAGRLRALPNVFECPFQPALAEPGCRGQQLDRLFDIGLGRGIRDEFEERLVARALAGIAQALGDRTIQTQRDLYRVHTNSVDKTDPVDGRNHVGCERLRRYRRYQSGRSRHSRDIDKW